MNLFNMKPSRRLASGMALIAATVSGVAWSQASNDANTAPIVVAQATGSSQARTGAAAEATTSRSISAGFGPPHSKVRTRCAATCSGRG